MAASTLIFRLCLLVPGEHHARKLTSSDHNTINIKIGTALYEVCGKIAFDAFKAFRYSRHVQPPDKGYLLQLIRGKERDVTPEEREAYRMEQLATLFMQAGMFNTTDDSLKFARIKLVVEHHIDARSVKQ